MGGCVFFFVPVTVVFVVDSLEVGNQNSVMSFSVVVLFCVCAARYHVIQNVICIQTYKQTLSTQSLLNEMRFCHFELSALKSEKRKRENQTAVFVSLSLYMRG